MGIISGDYCRPVPYVWPPLHPTAGAIYNIFNNMILSHLAQMIDSRIKLLPFDSSFASACISSELRFCMLQFPFGGKQEVVFHIPKNRRQYELITSGGRCISGVFPWTFYLRMHRYPYQYNLDISLLRPNGDGGHIMKGGYKEVRKMYKFSLSFFKRMPCHIEWRMGYRPSVIIATKKDIDSVNMSQVKGGMKCQQDFNLCHQGCLTLMPSPILLRVKLDSAVPAGERLYFEQPWFNGSLYDAIYKRYLHLDIDGIQKVTVVNNELFNPLLDVLKHLKTMHDDDKIHGDVSLKNLLLFMIGPNNFGGRLTDNDFTRSVTEGDISKGGYDSYCYWDDTCVMRGWMTKFTDIYGWGMCLGFVLLGESFDPFCKNPQRILEDDFIDSLLVQMREGINFALREMGAFSFDNKVFSSFDSLEGAIEERMKLESDAFVISRLFIMRKNVRLLGSVALWLQGMIRTNQQRYSASKSFQEACDMVDDTGRILSWFQGLLSAYR